MIWFIGLLYSMTRFESVHKGVTNLTSMYVIMNKIHTKILFLWLSAARVVPLCTNVCILCIYRQRCKYCEWTWNKDLGTSLSLDEVRVKVMMLQYCLYQPLILQICDYLEELLEPFYTLAPLVSLCSSPIPALLPAGFGFRLNLLPIFI